MKWNSRTLFLAALGTLLTAVNALAQNTPVALGQTLATSINTAMTITLSATDAGGDPLTYSVVTGPVHGSSAARLRT